MHSNSNSEICFGFRWTFSEFSLDHRLLALLGLYLLALPALATTLFSYTAGDNPSLSGWGVTPGDSGK